MPAANGLCAALEPLLPAPKRTKRNPAGGYLAFDPSRCSFLQEDLADAAQILSTQASSVRTLTDGGFTAESAVEAVHAGDIRKLEHSGLTSVQLLEPGTNTKENSDD